MMKTLLKLEKAPVVAGSYTHKIALPPERARELEGTIGFMVENNYLAMPEVPQTSASDVHL